MPTEPKPLSYEQLQPGMRVHVNGAEHIVTTLTERRSTHGGDYYDARTLVDVDSGAAVWVSNRYHEHRAEEPEVYPQPYSRRASLHALLDEVQDGYLSDVRDAL